MMPELPEVEVIARFLGDRVVGSTIQDAVVNRRDLRIAITGDFESLIVGQKIHSVERVAKYLILLLENGDRVVFHLGMSAKIAYVQSYNPQTHDHLVLVLDNGFYVTFNDVRRFGSVVLLNREQYASLCEKIGPEPFCNRFDANYLFAMKSGACIKTCLMNSSVVAGIGNIYASEILFRAGVLPNREARTLSLEECEKIVQETQATLRFAIKVGGSTIRDHMLPSGSSGRFQEYFMVYKREGKPCLICRSHIVREKRLGRSTFFCIQCQK